MRSLGVIADIDAHLKEPAAVPSPLSAEAVRALWESTFSTRNPFCPVDLKSFTKAVRATECAHGMEYKS